MKFHDHARIFHVLILFVQHFSLGVISVAEDAFYCTKTKFPAYSARRHKVKDVQRLQDLEERLSDLERRVDQKQMPNVIQIQSSAIPRGKLFLKLNEIEATEEAVTIKKAD